MNLVQLKTARVPEEILAKLDQYGVAVIENFADEAQVASLMKEYRACMDGAIPGLETKEYSAGQLFVVENNQHAKKELPATIKFYNSEFMEAISKAYFNNEDFLLNHEIYVCRDVKESDHVSQCLHYDREPTLKFFIYLNDVSKKNGAFHCVPGSHKETRKKEEYNRQNFIMPSWEETRAHNEKNVSREVAIEGGAGTLVIVHTDVFHRAGKLEGGERNLMRGHTRLLMTLEENWPQNRGVRGLLNKVRRRVDSLRGKNAKSY